MKRYLSLLVVCSILAFACRKNNNKDAVSMNVKTFWPNSGNAGTIVTLQGQGLTKDVSVSFNGTDAKVVDARDSILIVLAPEQGTSGTLTVKAGERKQDLGTYTYQALSLHGINPANGPAGTNISIRGAGFSSLEGPAAVIVNGKAALITAASDTLLIAVVPEGAGTGKVVVNVSGKTVSGPDFTFQLISSIKPVKGGAGTQVVISGTGFSTAATGNMVTFNGKPATVVSAADNKLVVTAPEGVATGPVAVSINGQKTVGNVFTVVPKPVIKTVAPLSGPAGAVVDITGDYFSTLADEVSVMFNGQPAVVTTTGDRQISVKVPAGAGAGALQIMVNGQQTTGPLFKEQALGVKQLLPDNGLAGTEVIVKGIGFSSNAGDNMVTFNGISVPVSEATDTTLRVVMPVGISTGAVQVKVGSLVAAGPVFKRAGVITFAGGPNSSAFNYPFGVAADKNGNVYVGDVHVIKKVAKDGTVTLFAGRADGQSGFENGTGTNASFNYVTGMVVDAQDNLYVVDQVNKALRKITPAGVVTTYARFTFTPFGIAIDKNGTLFVGGQYNGPYKLDAFGNATRLALNAYETPGTTMAVDNAGNIFYTSDDAQVLRISDGNKSIYTGFQWGYNDGPLRMAGLSLLSGIVSDPVAGVMYIADNNAVRMVTDDAVITVAGWKGGTAPPRGGYQDGTLNQALFSSIRSICVDTEGNMYVVEQTNKTVRKIFFK
ncbi:MAG: IPT/TIG domain-containing protein [Chitinophaga sp.]|uniref:IPT/TIG domain-containing protein n=1 Tax=Chitinophaga sp. TaxID=1869181 RepID=UPI001B04A5A4|nr:IPT/TIG domain-containing protein [Chitinophaga sp.]MBO9727300.1 IPT/TIG domain-containing protein [Chitinophaga sp.]